MRNLFLHSYIFVDLRSGSTLCRRLENPSYKGTTLLKVGEVLRAGDFEFTVLLAKRYDEESIVWECAPGSRLGQ